jgi:hypothetical protein
MKDQPPAEPTKPVAKATGKTAPDDTDLIAQKMQAGLSREQALEVIERQRKEDAEKQ